MMACEALDMEVVTGDDLHLMALDGSAVRVAARDCDGGESCYANMASLAPATTGTTAALDDRARVGRHPRWSRHETLILIEAKRVEEAKWSKVKEERERGIETARANSDSKWISISNFCERMGVVRSAAQCRKRWCNLSADYKRIRDWQSLRDKQSFWLMSNDVRKENRLPGCFDREVFDSLDKSLGASPSAPPEMIFDSGRPGGEDVLFSDIEHPLLEENLSVSTEKEMDSPAMDSTPGCYGEKFLNDKISVDGCDDAYDEEADVLPGRKKRKRPSFGESDIFSRDLCTLLENNNKMLASHINSQNLNCHLDRTQRKEHTDNLVLVLGRLAHAFGKIAEKL